MTTGQWLVKVLPRSDDRAPLARLRRQAVRIRKVCVHVLPAVDVEEDEHDLAVRRDAVAVDNRMEAPARALEGRRSARRDPGGRRERGDLRDRVDSGAMLTFARSGSLRVICRQSAPPHQVRAIRARGASPHAPTARSPRRRRRPATRLVSAPDDAAGSGAPFSALLTHWSVRQGHTPTRTVYAK